MKKQHTPGPWTFTNLDGGCHVTSKDSVILYYPFDNDLEHQANAKLIAAAPDLLAALQSACSYLADLNGCEWIKGDNAASIDMRQRAKAQQQKAFAAIAKALGV